LEQFTVFTDLTVPHGTLIYPGSFNPLHEGHVALIEAALLVSHSKLVLFELAVANADKPPLPREEVVRRLQQFHAVSNPIFQRHPKVVNFAVVLTKQSLFVNKAALFKGCTFLVGADTFSRLIDSRYYGPSNAVEPLSKQQREVHMLIALSTIKERGCRFLVGGRLATCHQNEVRIPLVYA